MNMIETNKLFLKVLYPEALVSQHPFPDYACCEGALESNWGKSRLFIEAKNLFGQKQGIYTSQYGTIKLPTREFINGQWGMVNADWVVFPTLKEAFNGRMALLERLRNKYPNYGLALDSPNGVEFITHVSETWSTDPNRGNKVLKIYNEYQSVFNEVKVGDSIGTPHEDKTPDTFWEFLLKKMKLK